MCVCVRTCMHTGASPPQYKAKPLERAGPDTPGPAGGRKGFLEEGTLGSTLKGEEKQGGPSCIQERDPWTVGTASIGKVKKPDWSFRSAQRNLNFTPRATGTWGRWLSGRWPDHVTQAEIGPTWHRAKGLHGEGTRFLSYSNPKLCPTTPPGRNHPFQ